VIAEKYIYWKRNLGGVDWQASKASKKRREDLLPPSRLTGVSFLLIFSDFASLL